MPQLNNPGYTHYIFIKQQAWKILFVLLFFVSAKSSAQQSLQLDSAINIALKNSYDIQVAKNNVDQANTNLIIARYDLVLRSMVLDYYSGRLTF